MLCARRILERESQTGPIRRMGAWEGTDKGIGGGGARCAYTPKPGLIEEGKQKKKDRNTERESTVVEIAHS